MKTAGIALIVIGIIMMAYTGFTYITTEKVAEIGSVKITKEKDHPVQWSPIVGVALFIGGVLMLVTNKKNNA
jgi:uncharacterized membrane protein YdcZ (DUF606 family)